MRNNLFDRSINSVNSIMLGVPQNDNMYKASVDTTALSINHGNANNMDVDSDIGLRSPNGNVKQSGFLDSS